MASKRRYLLAMKERAMELQREADHLRESTELVSAGDVYTRAAHEWAGAVTNRVFPGSDYTIYAVGELLKATTCYRIVDKTFLKENRCELGIVLAEDQIEFIDNQDIEEGSFADLRRGAWPEFIGDLRLIAGRDDAAEAYEVARSIYETAGSGIEVVSAEKEHIRLMTYFKQVREGLQYDIPRDAPERRPPGITFPEWLEYKRRQLPDLLDQLEEQGSWPVGD